MFRIAPRRTRDAVRPAWLLALAVGGIAAGAGVRALLLRRAIRRDRRANRELQPYANAPEDLRPFSKFTEPYYENYTKLVEYNGARARRADAEAGRRRRGARSAFSGPWRTIPTRRSGSMMLNGAQLAIEEANARGGYGGKPFKLMIHNDQAIWGASSNEIVKMAYDDKVWAMLGSISGDSTHIALRVSLQDRSARSSTAPPPIPPFPRPSFPGISPPFRTIACRATRWRAASTPISA